MLSISYNDKVTIKKTTKTLQKHVLLVLYCGKYHVKCTDQVINSYY